jgi:hypothetical protein
VSLEARLAALKSIDEPPTIGDVGGEALFLEELRGLPEHLLARAAEALWVSWQEVTDRPAALTVLLGRAADIEGDLEFGDIGEAAVAAAWAEGPSSIEAVSIALLAVLDEDGIQSRPLRAAYAVRHAAALAAQDGTPTRARLLARIADIDDVPSSAAASFVRAYGQLNDIEQTPWLEEKIARLAQDAEAAPQAAVELALGDLRRAFASDSEEGALQYLRSATKKFRAAGEADEHRDDAVGLEAVAQCVLAFANRDAEQVEVWAQVAERAGRQLAAGRWRGSPSGVEAKVGGWVTLLAELRELRVELDSSSVLHVERAVRAIARAYGGLRLIEIEDERFGLRAVVVPQSVAALAASDIKRAAMLELASEAGSPDAAYGAARLLEEVRPDPKATAARRRRRLRCCAIGEPARLHLIRNATS